MDLSLFVTGLNHSRNHPQDQYVDQAGVNQLVDFIVNITPDPDGLVIALTGSMLRDCTAGPSFKPASGGVRNGHCVASLLQERLNRPFNIEQYDIWNEGSRTGGNAVITGPRWKVVGIDPSRTTQGAHYLGVRLHDQRKALNAPGSSFSLYVMHTSVNDRALPEIASVATKAWNIAARQPLDLPPMIVGDFNTPECNGGEECQPASEAWRVAPELDAYITSRFDMADRGLRCPSFPPGKKLRMENDLIHVLQGRRSGPLSFGCSPGRLQPVRVSYVTDGGGQPYYWREGINLVFIRHNVVGINFQVVAESPPSCGGGARCEAGACVPISCECSAAGDVGQACRRNDQCGNACQCKPGLMCQSGRCARLGFYRQHIDSAVYLAYSVGEHCRVSSEQQLKAYRGEGAVTPVDRIDFGGSTNTGTCGWPNGFYKEKNNPRVYRMYGEATSFGIGQLWCKVRDGAQMNAFGGFGLVQEVDAGSDLGRGRDWMRECANP